MIGVAGRRDGWGEGEKPFIAPLFTDKMVLQREVKDAIWGWSTPGAEDHRGSQGKRVFATADAQGKWLAMIGPFKAGGPYTLTVTGPQTATLQNVLFGDVWICSGQSNMDIGISIALDAQEEIAAADHPEIRLFVVKKAATIAPRELLDGEWAECSPQEVATDGWQGFSAVAYFFGRQLHHDLHVPIGLVLNAWSGMPAEPLHYHVFTENAAGIRGLAKQLELSYQDPAGAMVNFTKDSEAWWAANDPGVKAGWQHPIFAASAWNTLELPERWKEGALGKFTGIAWFRKEIILPKAWDGQPAVLHLGPIFERDIAWVNGVEVGVSGSHEHPPCDYPIPAGVLKEGKNVIAVSVLGHGGENGFAAQAEQMKLELADKANTEAPIALAGPWQYQLASKAPTFRFPHCPS